MNIFSLTDGCNVCVWTRFYWQKTPKTNVRTREESFCAVLGQHSSNIISGQSSMNSCLSLQSITLSHGNRVRGRLTVGRAQSMFCITIQVTIDGQKNLWLRLQMKPVLLPALRRVPAACQVFVTAHKASIVWLQLTRRKTSVLQYEWSARNLSFSKLTKETFSPCRIKKKKKKKDLQPSTQRQFALLTGESGSFRSFGCKNHETCFKCSRTFRESIALRPDTSDRALERCPCTLSSCGVCVYRPLSSVQNLLLFCGAVFEPHNRWTGLSPNTAQKTKKSFKIWVSVWENCNCLLLLRVGIQTVGSVGPNCVHETTTCCQNLVFVLCWSHSFKFLGLVCLPVSFAHMYPSAWQVRHTTIESGVSGHSKGRCGFKQHNATRAAESACWLQERPPAPPLHVVVDLICMLVGISTSPQFDLITRNCFGSLEGCCLG